MVSELSERPVCPLEPLQVLLQGGRRLVPAEQVDLRQRRPQQQPEPGYEPAVCSPGELKMVS